MLKIAICDDEIEVAKKIRKMGVNGYIVLSQVFKKGGGSFLLKKQLISAVIF